MNPAEQKWQDARNRLMAETAGFAQVECRIPRWEPVDLAMGLKWLQSSICEGYYVRHRITSLGDKAIVHFKIWEFGDAEPEFTDV